MAKNTVQTTFFTDAPEIESLPTIEGLNGYPTVDEVDTKVEMVAGVDHYGEYVGDEQFEPGVQKKTIDYDREVEIEGKKYNIYKPLPTSFLKSKLSEKSTYLPVPVYRTIIRQINNDSINRYGFEEFSIPKFSEKPVELYEGKTEKGGNVKSIKSMYCDCFVQWTNPITHTKQLLHGVGYSAMSIDMLLTDSALHGNMHTLRAKALRDAMKYSYAIFEFPEDDYEQEDTNVKAELKEKKQEISDVVKSIVSDTKEVQQEAIAKDTKQQEESKINLDVLELRIQGVKDQVSNLKEFASIATVIKKETMETFGVTEDDAKSALQPLLSKYRELRNIK